MIRKEIIKKRCIGLRNTCIIICILIAMPSMVYANQGDPINVTANFHLYGEMYRFSNLGWGNLGFVLGINSETISTGYINTNLFENPTSSGIFQNISIPSGIDQQFIKLDHYFSVPIQLKEGEPASLYIKLDAGANREVIDFSDDIRYGTSILPLDTENQSGLTLLSFTVPNGYKLNFINENTNFEAFGSFESNLQTNTSIAPNPAIVNFDLVRSSVKMDPELHFGVSPDPNPLVFDTAYAQTSGTNNIVVNPSRIETVAYINLTPTSATNPVGQTHIVTATLKDSLGNPQPNIMVTFNVTSGPNSGVTGTSNTDNNGNASFNYSDVGGAGIDNIVACFANLGGHRTCSQTVTKEWIAPLVKGKITGGGWIKITGDPKATFGFNAQYPGNENIPQGSVEYQDHVAGLNIKSTKINSVSTSLDKKKGVITGLAKVNDKGSYPFEVYIEDNGEPGKDVDIFKISLPSYPYSNGAILSSGNIQIHS